MWGGHSSARVCVCGEKMNVEFGGEREKKGRAGSVSGTCTSHHAVNGNFVSIKELIVGSSWLLTAELCMAGNTFNRELKYSQVMLGWHSITLRAVGVNVNINRFHREEKKEKNPKQKSPSAHAAIGAISELALRWQRWRHRLKSCFRD